MRTSLQLSPNRESHLSQECRAELRDLLLAETATQAARGAEHEALFEQLRGMTDGDSILERELAEAGAARAHEAVADIEHALERIEKRTYGWCEGCGEAMPLERLEAIPSARLCVACPGRRGGWQR